MPITRRQFLAGVGGLGLASTLSGCEIGPVPSLELPRPSSPFVPQPEPEPVKAADGILVVLTLYGGNDGLDTVIPASNGAYRSARGTLARDPAEVLDLGGEGLGLHPSLKGLHQEWQAQRLAVVRGVGFPDLDRSHFHCMDVWQTAGEPAATTGWLGRWLDATGTDPLRALAIGNDLPLLLQGLKASGSVVPTGGMRLPGGDRLIGLFGELSKPAEGAVPLAATASAAGTNLLTVAAEVTAALAAVPATTTTTAPAAVPSPGGDTMMDSGGSKAGGDASAAPGTPAMVPGDAGELGPQLDLVRRLIESGMPTRVYSVSMGGFDTHANERATHDRLMGQLDVGLTRFLNAMRRRPVTVVAYSEFGRRLGVNASNGTDHGSAGPAFVVGTPVRGGFYGDEPSLTNLAGGDLRYNVDYRTLYATLLTGVLGIDADVALADASRYPALPLLA